MPYNLVAGAITRTFGAFKKNKRPGTFSLLMQQKYLAEMFNYNVVLKYFYDWQSLKRISLC